MKKSETIQVIALLAGNYDSIANKSDKQKTLMVNTWLECLGDLDYQLVLQAVKKSMIDSPYPPTISDIRKNAIEMINPSTEKTAIEAWHEAVDMISHGLYMTQEEFDKHSPIVKKFFHNPSGVKQISMQSSDVVNSVVKGQFLKQYEILVNREQEQKLLPENMKEKLKEFQNKIIKQIGD